MAPVHGLSPPEAEVSAGAQRSLLLHTRRFDLITPFFKLMTARVCDGSGGVAIDEKHFVIVNDETSELLIMNDPGPAYPNNA